MKILFIADVSLENPTSGSEQVLYQQGKGSAVAGMDVYAITRQEGLPCLSIRNVVGVTEGVFGASAQAVLTSVLALARYPSKLYTCFTMDIPFRAVVSHQPFNCFVLLLTGKLKNAPILYVFHSPSHEEYLLSHEHGGSLRAFPHIFARRMIERFCLKKARRIMVLSEYMKRKVTAIHQIPAERIVVNPGGVDLSQYKPLKDRQRVKRDLEFPADRIHLLSVRNLDPRMGLDNLLKCIRILKMNGIDVHLILGGEGPERHDLQALILELGLSQDVTMTGFIETDMLPLYYGASDFFVLPTRCLEGFGLVTPESMACGTPVLGTPVGGTREILSGFDSGFLFRDSSPEAMAHGIETAIGEYIGYDKKYNDLRFRCREYVARNYSWQRHTNQLKSILNEILVDQEAHLH